MDVSKPIFLIIKSAQKKIYRKYTGTQDSSNQSRITAVGLHHQLVQGVCPRLSATR